MGVPQVLNLIELEAVYQMRECFSEGRKSTLYAQNEEEKAELELLAKKAIFPEKPLISFVSGEEEKDMAEVFKYSRYFAGKKQIRRFVTCGGVDDGKSTLIGRIIYEAASKQEKEKIHQNQAYLRCDGTVDFAMLAGCSEEEARQGITVQVSYSVFEQGDCAFLMADVPGHEEYTYNMAYAALGAESAVVMTAANKGIVPQTKRHVRICYFMGIRSIVFAVNKMDLVSYNQEIFLQVEREIAAMMQEYPDCNFCIVPVAAKAGENITTPCADMLWYKNGTPLDAIREIEIPKERTGTDFCMQVQRVCKSSQMDGAKVKQRVIQGEVLSGTLSIGDEVLIYPTLEKSTVTGLYALDTPVSRIGAKIPAGIEFARELDVTRGYILAKEDNLTVEERIEADILWTADNRLTQGKRYEIQCGSRKSTAVITKICYQMDVNTGEHKYAEYVVKNALARCELSFSTPFAIACVQENRSLGTFRIIDRKDKSLAGYGNVMRTVTAGEREAALGQKSGMILLEKTDCVDVWMNYVERYLLRMGFHTMQTVLLEKDTREINRIGQLLAAGLILLLPIEAGDKKWLEGLLEEKYIFDCAVEGQVPRKIKQWASKLID